VHEQNPPGSDANPPGGDANPPGGDATVNGDMLDDYRQSRVPVSRIYEPSTLCAVLGASGRPEQDLLLENLREDGVPWLHRRGGGGTVVLGPGQVVLAVVTEVDSPFKNKEYAAEINSWIVEALVCLSIRGVHPAGISDLAIGEKKIVGTSIYRTRLVLFYQASLLVHNDISLFTRYLAMPVKVPDYRRGRTHEEFCTTLAREGYTGSVAEVVDALKAAVESRLPRLR
jgi:lipoate-protein ligase A